MLDFPEMCLCLRILRRYPDRYLLDTVFYEPDQQCTVISIRLLGKRKAFLYTCIGNPPQTAQNIPHPRSEDPSEDHSHKIVRSDALPCDVRAFKISDTLYDVASAFQLLSVKYLRNSVNILHQIHAVRIDCYDAVSMSGILSCVIEKAALYRNSFSSVFIVVQDTASSVLKRIKNILLVITASIIYYDDVFISCFHQIRYVHY